MLKSGLVAFACSISVCAFAVAETPKSIDVPAGSLGAALDLISKQAGVELIFRPEQVEGLHTNGVTGSLSAHEAVKKLLEGTQLQVRSDEATGAMMIGLVPPPAAAPKAESTAADEASAASEAPKPTSAPATSSNDGFWSRFRLAQANTSSRADSTDSDSERARESSRRAEPPLEQVLITGTHIRGADNPTVPLIVIDRDFIDSTGMTTVVQLIESLPQNFALVNQSATGGSLSGNSFSSIQGSTVNLRGMGEGTTLTLVNGRRMALGYDGSAVNVSALPLSAIERVEVLTDGASALYGSDAVGGVVNFVFREDFDGVESQALYGDAHGTDEYRLSHVQGMSWGSGNVVVSGEFYSRELLKTSDRPFASRPGVGVTSLLPKENNYALTLNARQDVTEAGEIFLQGLYIDRDSYNRSFENSPISAADIYTDNVQISLNGGISWQLGADWAAELSVGYGEDDLDGRTYDPLAFAPIGMTPIVSKLVGADVKVDGPLLKLPGGTVRVALGAHRREEKHDYALRSFTLDGTQASGFDFYRERRVSSVFAEAAVPLVGASNALPFVRRLDLSLAARHDDYSDFGSSVDPRIGLAWMPLEGLKLRGAWGTAFLAPKLKDFDVAFNGTVSVVNDPLSNGLHSIVMIGNDPDRLKSQESSNYTFGFDYSPPALRGLTLTFNYYRIDYRDRIEDLGALAPSVFLENPAAFGNVVTLNPTVEQVNEAIAKGLLGQGFFTLDGAADYAPIPDFDPTTVDVIFNTLRTNVGIVKQRGFDFSASYGFSVGASNLGLSLDVAYIDRIRKQLTPTSEEFSVLDTFRNPTRVRARVGFSLSRGGWSANTFVHHRNSYKDDRVTPALPLDAYTTADLNVGYRFGSGAGVLSDLSIVLSSCNLFDEDPPQTAVRGPGYWDIGFDAANASAIGRLTSLSLTKRW